MESTINFFSLNVGMSSSLAGLPMIINAEQLDIIFLQEVRVTSDQIENLLKLLLILMMISLPGLELLLCGGRIFQSVMFVLLFPVDYRWQVLVLTSCSTFMLLVVLIRGMIELSSLVKRFFKLYKWTLNRSGCWGVISTAFWRPVILREGLGLPRRIVQL